MCQCSQNSAVINVVSSPPQTLVVDTSCEKTVEELLGKKVLLEARKTPENTGFINSQLGLIQTMLNYGRYCMYNIDV